MEKLEKRYKNLSLPLRATIWFAACQFIQKGIGMITTPIFTRLLSTSEYGRVSSFLSWADILMPLFTLSVWRGMMNLFAKDYDKDEVLSTTISLSVVISAVWSGIILLCSDFLTNYMSITSGMLVGLLFYCFAQNTFYAWMVRMQYDYKYKPLAIATLLYSVISSVAGALAVVLISRTAESKVYPQIICLMVIVVCIIIVSLKNKPVLCNKTMWLFCLGFALPLIPHYLSEVILQSSDRAMINSMCGTSDVAIYSIAYSVGSLINLVAAAINSAFVPYQYQKIKSGDFKTLAKSTNIVIGFVAFCLCGVMLFGREVVLVFGGEKYLDSISLIIPISLGVFFNYVFQLFARVQEYFEQKHTIVVASLACALLNIILNYIFIKLYSYKAAAYTTFFCYFAFCFLHYMFYRKACMNNVKQEIYDIRALAAISAILILCAIVIGLIGNMYVIKYALLAMAIILMVVCRKKIIDFAKSMREG